MRQIAQIFLLFSLASSAQSTRIFPNEPLESLGVKVFLNKLEDTLFIKAKEGDLKKISIVKRKSSSQTRRTGTLNPIEDNYYAIPLNHYDIGVYTIEVHYKPHIYPFKMDRLKNLPMALSPHPNIRTYKAVYGIVNAFGARTGQINALTPKKLENLISKFETDKITRSGFQNWLKIYAVYDDNTEGLYYQID